jgi:hypothetical protein
MVLVKVVLFFRDNGVRMRAHTQQTPGAGAQLWEATAWPLHRPQSAAGVEHAPFV